MFGEDKWGNMFPSIRGNVRERLRNHDLDLVQELDIYLQQRFS